MAQHKGSPAFETVHGSFHDCLHIVDAFFLTHVLDTIRPVSKIKLVFLQICPEFVRKIKHLPVLRRPFSGAGKTAEMALARLPWSTAAAQEARRRPVSAQQRAAQK
jgi:hypothetical protein